MIDHDGVEWLTADEIAERLPVKRGTVTSWRRRGKVAAHRIDGSWLMRWPDAMDAERDTRGRYLALRSDQLHTG